MPFYHQLEYTPDALHSLFAGIANQPWAMLLSSGFAEHSANRFDIMVADPCGTLQTYGAVTQWSDGDAVSHSTADPLTLLQLALERLNLKVASHPDFPFQGGALGLFGYDLAWRFEKLPETAIADLRTPDMAIGLYDWAVIADHQRHTLTLISHHAIHLRLHWLLNLPTSGGAAPFRLTDKWRSNLTAGEYKACFDEIQRNLLSGDCYQVNLAQRFSASYQGDEWQAFRLLNQQNRAPFSAFIRLSQSVILSFSPERFLRLHQDEVETRPIKGTLPRLSDPDADHQQRRKLASSVKDRSENLMIVDLLRNDIGRVAQPGSVKVPELFVVEPFPAVHHLVSTVRARLKAGLNGSDLLRACFPGGSITGAPKIRAMELIDKLEPHRRNAWCGSIGYLSVCGRMDTNITIRTLIAEQGRLYCSVGGGIVADSNWRSEYQETFDKINRILPCLLATLSKAT